MRLTVLGSGTSHGVPVIGCSCPVCSSDNPRNKRFRPCILVESDGRSVLVDTPPDLRSQALAFGVSRVDAVLMTHAHADHVFGMDDLRSLNGRHGEALPVYGSEQTLEDIRRIFRYVFVTTQWGGGKPRLQLKVAPDRWNLYGLDIQTVPVLHGQLPVNGYRFNDVAYVTDVSHIPPASMAKLRGLDVLILDAVQPHPHPTHFSLHEALAVIEHLKPRRAYLTHLCHAYDHDPVEAALPPGVHLAYDGLTLTS